MNEARRLEILTTRCISGGHKLQPRKVSARRSHGRFCAGDANSSAPVGSRNRLASSIRRFQAREADLQLLGAIALRDSARDAHMFRPSGEQMNECVQRRQVAGYADTQLWHGVGHKVR